MGVVHKLREDVVSFIVEQKRNNPSIGVRKLADLTSETFQTKISKSSVSGILKRCDLNSGVGRPTGSSGSGEKFSIPPTKKKEISKSLGKAGFVKEEKLSLMPDSVAQQDPVAPEPPPKQERKEEKEATDQTEEFKTAVEQARERKKKQQIAVPAGMGFIFLKAAQWEMSKPSMMERLLKKHVQGEASQDLDPEYDRFLFLKYAGAETADHVKNYQGHGAWALHNVPEGNLDGKNKEPTLKKLFEWEQSLKEGPALSKIALDYHQEKTTALLEVAGFILGLQDGSQMVVDAPLSTFGDAEALSPAQETLPLNKALEWLSERLISNIQKAVFNMAPKGERFDRALYEMISVFENVPGKQIIKAAVVDEHQKQIAEFTTIPARKRIFMLGLNPRQKEFGDLTKSVKWAGKRPFYHAQTDQSVYFAETKTDFFKVKVPEAANTLRVITLWDDNAKDPCWAILTNETKAIGKEILAAYMSRWPYWNYERSQEGKTAKNIKKAEKIKTLSELFSDYMQSLYQFSQRHYFNGGNGQGNIKSFLSDICSLAGKMQATREGLMITLDADRNSAGYQDLKQAAQSVNERNIVDPYGRRLWLEV